MSSPEPDADLTALFVDVTDDVPDFGFTRRLMDRVTAQDRLRRRVLLVAGGLAFAVAAPLMMSLAHVRFGMDSQTLMSFTITLAATGLALGGVGYAVREA
jgi:hypothetical protein